MPTKGDICVKDSFTVIAGNVVDQQTGFVVQIREYGIEGPSVHPWTDIENESA